MTWHWILIVDVCRIRTTNEQSWLGRSVRQAGTILPAPESAHVRGAIDEALKCKETGETKTILFGLTGTGYFDMTAYAAYANEGRMSDSVPDRRRAAAVHRCAADYPGDQE